jgi:hypothetical protein
MVVLLLLLCMLHLLMQLLHLLTHILPEYEASLPPPAAAHAEFVLFRVGSKNSIVALHLTIAGDVLRLAPADLTVPPLWHFPKKPILHSPIRDVSWKLHLGATSL